MWSHFQAGILFKAKHFSFCLQTHLVEPKWMGGGCRTWETGSCPSQRPILQSQLSSVHHCTPPYLSVAFSLHPKHLTSLSLDSYLCVLPPSSPLSCKGARRPRWTAKPEPKSICHSYTLSSPPSFPPSHPASLSDPSSILPLLLLSSPLPGLSQLGSVHFSMRWDRKHTHSGAYCSSAKPGGEQRKGLTCPRGRVERWEVTLVVITWKRCEKRELDSHQIGHSTRTIFAAIWVLFFLLHCKKFLNSVSEIFSLTLNMDPGWKWMAGI